MKLSQLKALFVEAGAKKLYAKPLAPQDNSKNQVYFGPGFEALNLFPNEGIVADSSLKNSIFKAKIKFGWMTTTGAIADAPRAQLILYPQYPEVRFSGFLMGCEIAPSSLMANRLSGRVLFLAVTADNNVVGFVAGRDDELAIEFTSLKLTSAGGVFFELSLPSIPDQTDSRARLLAELRRINRQGWIDSTQLDSKGNRKPCRAPQCGGFTLECELGIPKNSAAEPDFLGWEIKQHTVTGFGRANSSAAITLMTPEPTGGLYKNKGVEAFVRKFGYPDKNNKPDRLNFGGIHRVGLRQQSTGLTMLLTGYDSTKGKITNANGSVALVSDTGEVAAEWTFTGLLAHWSRKHTKAVYVPSMRRKEPRWQYAYDARVRLAQRTDGLLLLKALADGAVYYDPGIKLEYASSQKPTSKKRSQFRVASKHIDTLYEIVETAEA
jgi:hypothetical protein